MGTFNATEVKEQDKDEWKALYPEITIDGEPEILDNVSKIDPSYTKLIRICGSVKNADTIYIYVKNLTTEARNKANGTNDICKIWYERPTKWNKFTGKWEYEKEAKQGNEYRFAASALIEDVKEKKVVLPEEKICSCRNFTVKLFDEIFNKTTIFAAKNMEKRAGVYKLDKQKLIDAINKTTQRYGINNCLRLAHFLGQIAHESANFNTTEEYADGSRYEGNVKNLGNTQAGDGKKFKGRGLIQLTGRNNYQKYTDYVKSKFGETVDFIKDPDIIASNITYAVDVAGWYWSVARDINSLADKDDITAVTKAINGGTNGLTDRTNKTNKAKEILKYNDCKFKTVK